MVKLVAEQIPVTAKQTPLLVLGAFEDEVEDILKELDGISPAIVALVDRVIKDKEHTGSFGRYLHRTLFRGSYAEDHAFRPGTEEKS